MEQVTNWELGFKLVMLDGTLRVKRRVLLPITESPAHLAWLSTETRSPGAAYHQRRQI